MFSVPIRIFAGILAIELAGSGFRMQNGSEQTAIGRDVRRQWRGDGQLAAAHETRRRVQAELARAGTREMD